MTAVTGRIFISVHRLVGGKSAKYGDFIGTRLTAAFALAFLHKIVKKE